MEDQKIPLTGFCIKHRHANASLVNLMPSSGGRSCTHGGLWHQCCTGCPRRLSGTWHVVNPHYDEMTWDTAQCIHQAWIRVLVLRTEVKHSSHAWDGHPFQDVHPQCCQNQRFSGRRLWRNCLWPRLVFHRAAFLLSCPQWNVFFRRNMQSCQLFLHFLRHCCSNAPPREGCSSYNMSRVGHLTDLASGLALAPSELIF